MFALLAGRRLIGRSPAAAAVVSSAAQLPSFAAATTTTTTSSMSPLFSPLFGARFFSHKTHQATKKRFKARGSGAIVFKPSGRQHGMSRHGRSRNQDKGRSVVISRGEKGDLWKRVQGLEVNVAGGLKTRRAPTPRSSTYYTFNYSNLRDSQSPIALQKQAEAKLKEELATLEPVKVLKGFNMPTPKNKVQWRLVGQTPA